MEEPCFTEYLGIKGQLFQKSLKHSDYVLNKYGEAIVVFDGYKVASTKDLTHMRCSKGKLGPIVSFTPDMKLSCTKDLFLSNKTNKQNFISMLGAELQKYNCKVYHDSADADYLIVKKAIDTAESMDTILVGDDTDLLVLLIFHTQPQGKDIFFVPEPKKKYKSLWMEYKGDEEKLGPILCKHILFMHAFLGCDTTS